MPRFALPSRVSLRRARLSAALLSAVGLSAGGLSVLALTACGTNDTVAPVGARVLTLGVVQSLTGSAAIYGTSVRDGIELATRQINSRATASTLRVAYSIINDSSATAASTAAFSTLVTRKVDVLIGPTLSTLAPNGHALAQSAGIPVLAATPTAVGITDVGSFVFRVALAENVVVPGMLARVAPLISLTRAVLIVDGSDVFSRNSADAMRLGVALQNATILREIDIATQDLPTELTRLQGQSFNAFLVTPLVEKSAPALVAIRAARFSQPILGGNSFNTLDIARTAGAAAEGVYVGAAWNPGSTAPASVAFTAAFQAAFGRAPDQFAAQGYAAVLVAYDAATRANGTGTGVPTLALRDAMAATRNLDTPLGLLSMSTRREALHTPVVQQFRGGQLVLLPER